MFTNRTQKNGTPGDGRSESKPRQSETIHPRRGAGANGGARPATEKDDGGKLNEGTKRSSAKPKLAEIANECGVSIATVSYVLSNRRSISISAPTRERVREVAQRLGYPLDAGSEASRQWVRTVGLLFDSTFSGIEGPDSDLLNDTFAAVMHYAGRHSLRVLVYGPDHQDGLAARLWKDDGVEGIIVVRETNTPDILPSILRSLVPCVDFGTDEARYCVDVDHQQALGLALKHLSSLGHQRVAMIRASDDYYPGIRQQLAFMQVGTAMRMETVLIPNEEALATTFRGPKPPSALVACSDLQAIRAIDRLQVLGLKVPQDASVVTLQGHLRSQSARPPLTAVHYPLELMLEAAIALLEEQAQGLTIGGQVVRVEATLIERDSVAEGDRIKV